MKNKINNTDKIMTFSLTHLHFSITFILFLLFCGSCSPTQSYDIYQIDNGNDYVQEGLVRIIDKTTHKMGYATPQGKVMIQPQFAFGFPFKNGRAKVTTEGELKEVSDSQGEYHYWESSSWFYIDKQGNKISKK